MAPFSPNITHLLLCRHIDALPSWTLCPHSFLFYRQPSWMMSRYIILPGAKPFPIGFPSGSAVCYWRKMWIYRHVPRFVAHNLPPSALSYILLCFLYAIALFCTVETHRADPGLWHAHCLHGSQVLKGWPLRDRSRYLTLATFWENEPSRLTSTHTQTPSHPHSLITTCIFVYNLFYLLFLHHS